jgi:putative ABC transport system ATP-binding protein
MVTHDAHAASYADRIVVLVDGLVVRDVPSGDPDEILDLMKSATA